MSGEKYRIDLTPEERDKIQIHKNVPKDINIDTSIIQEENYTISFPYKEDYGKLPMGISVSPKDLDFGQIESGEAISRSHKLSVFSPSNRKYSVFIFQDTNLMSESNIQIPNTTCDSGSCTSILSDAWISPLTYGFGYTCENNQTCISSFHKDYYRRLATVSNDEPPVEIIRSVKNTTSNMLFKINVPGNQNKDSYKTTVHYLLSPHY